VTLVDALGIEAARPRRIAAWPRAYWLVVATVCVGAFMGQLDASIVSVALPAIGHDLGAGVGAVEWVALAYLLTLVGLVAPVGRLADTVGRKSLYLYGFAVFSVASALCGFAPNLPALTGCRVLQAVGAAMLQANSVALIRAAVPSSRLGRALGVQGAAQAVGLACGPAVGGLLLSVADWRWLFWINVPAGAVGLVSGWFLLPRTRNRRPSSPVDWRGLSLFLAATSLVMLALSIAEHRSALGIAVGLLAIAVVAATALVRRERRTIAPLFDAVLLRSRRFTSGLVAGLFAYATLFGVLVVTPFYLAAARHASAEAVGLQLAALPVALGLIAPVAGYAADRVSSRRITMLGLSVAAAGFVALSIWHASTPGLVAGLAVVGLGLGLFTPANNVSVMGAAPSSHAGAAAGILNMTRGLGTALGVALAGLTYALVAGGPHATAAAAGRGLSATTVLLAGLALLAVGVVRLARGRTGPQDDHADHRNQVGRDDRDATPATDAGRTECHTGHHDEQREQPPEGDVAGPPAVNLHRSRS
jgi:EmrB/QacA subfamily drug resistance transporter